MNTLQILQYLHCRLCLEEYSNTACKSHSRKDYQKIEAGWTKLGLQIWCTRHNCNIIHIDFEGIKHQADITRKKSNIIYLKKGDRK